MTDDGQRSDGWRQMLNVYIARPLDTAIDRAGQNYTYTELYTDPTKKAAWEQDVLEQLPGLVNRQTDGMSATGRRSGTSRPSWGARPTWWPRR